MKKRFLKRSEVLREGYVKGLQKAQSIIRSMLNEGWTGLYMYDTSRKSIIDKITNEFYTWKEQGRSCEVLKATMVGSTYYCLMKLTGGSYCDGTGNSCVMIGVALTQKRGDELLVKDMTENEGPNDGYKCPLSYIRMADEPKSEFAAQWREMCISQGRSRKDSSDEYNSLERGDLIQLKGCSFHGKKEVYFMGWSEGRRKPWMRVSFGVELDDSRRLNEYNVQLPKKYIGKVIKKDEYMREYNSLKKGDRIVLDGGEDEFRFIGWGDKGKPWMTIQGDDQKEGTYCLTPDRITKIIKG